MGIEVYLDSIYVTTVQMIQWLCGFKEANILSDLSVGKCHRSVLR